MDVLELINDFIQHLNGGESYWIDLEGNEHTTDVGYGLDFWDQIYSYIHECGGIYEFAEKYKKWRM